ncbi:MAG: hypothetical protein KatS3mg105_5121 [Gemmatales bacterium]|nr:MAG: hypothetical protein KatS3mg105_5121 [Gemmatales bacterium]
MRIAYVLLVVLLLNPIARADEPGMITLLESVTKSGYWTLAWLSMGHLSR